MLPTRPDPSRWAAVHRARAVMALACAALSTAPLSARAEESRSYTLDEAVAEALARHPRLAAAAAAIDAAEAQLAEARDRYAPAAGVSAEIARSTGNTPPGAFFPVQGFVPVSGSPRGKAFDGGSWQTGVGAWADWDVLSVSRQAAASDVALAARAQASADIDAQRLEIGYQAADAFLLLLEAEEAVRAAGSNAQRAQVLVTATKPLVVQNLRPGVDAARAEAELAAAQTHLARAEQAREVARAALAESMGDAGVRVEATPGPLLGPIADAATPARANADAHPRVIAAAAAATRADRARRLVDVEYLPRLDLVAALWARGSGLYDSPAAGVVPDIPNWAAGLVFTWSVLDIPAIEARAHAAAAGHAAAVAQRDEVALAVSGQVARASAVLEGSIRVAAQTPAALTSARAAEQQALARYQSGLAPILDVADAQRVLAQAEIDDAVARLEVRRALLLVARASGDLRPFFAQVRGGGG